MLTISCRECRRQYELENSMGGRQFACGCGNKFAIPALEPSGDFVACQACGNVSPDGSVICIECGYNFRSGSKTKTKKKSRDDDELGFWLRYGAAIKKLVLLLVIGTIALLIYRSYTTKPFGITPEAPLGTISEVHNFLKELNFDCTESLAPPRYPDCKISIYANAQKAKETRGLIDESVVFMSDRSGRIVAACGSYSIPVGAVSATGTVVSRFFRRLQEELEMPAKPDFKQVVRGTGTFKSTEDICNWQNSKVKIFWIKVEHSQGLISSTNNFTVCLNNLAPEKIFADSAREF